MVRFLVLALTLTGGSAIGATITDQIHPDVALKVDASTLTCSAGSGFGDFPVSGEVILQIPRLNDYTELEHYPALTLLSSVEDCVFLPSVLATAAAQQGFLSVDLRVVLSEERIAGGGACRLDLVETASIALAGRSLISERRVSRPCE